MNLRELTVLANQIELLLVDSVGEMTEEIEKAMALKEAALPDKVESYTHVIEKLKHSAQFYAKKANDLIKLSDGFDKMSDRLLNNLDQAMNELKVDELTGHDHKVKRQLNPASLVIEKPEDIPDKFKTLITETKINKEAIKIALKNGLSVPGCSLTQGYRLKIGLNK